MARELDLEGKRLWSQYNRISMLRSDPRNVNIPWPDQGMGDGDYMHAFQKVVMPIATEFDPDLVISKADGFPANANISDQT